MDHPLSPVSLFELVLLLMVLVVPLEIVARRMHLPPAAALILAGMALAFLPAGRTVPLDPDLMLVLFLPPLLMSSAFLTAWRDFRANLSVIAALAVGAVAFTTACVGVAAHWMLPGLPWAVCFALGAIVSPPDALAAKAVLQRVALPQRMLVLLEGESLVNDASGLVLFRLALAAALTGSFSLVDAVGSFVVLSVGGVLIGLVFGVLSTRLLSRLQEPALIAVGSLLTAWASYIVADRAGTSGVLSSVACGLVMGWRQHEVLTAAARTGAGSVWAAVEFVLESLVFVLIGLSLSDVLHGLGGGVGGLVPAIAAVVAAVVLSRFVWLFATIYGVRLASGRWRTRPPIAVPVVMGWAGMRGVVSLAIALSLPADLPGRDFIVLTTFVVILVTVLVQGSTLAPLIRLLGLDPASAPGAASLTELQTRIRLAEARLVSVRREAHAADGTLRHPRLLEQYEYQLAVLQRVIQVEGGMPTERAAHFDLILAAVTAARVELLRLHRAGTIDDGVLRGLERELDLEELTARQRRGDQPAPP